MARNASEWELHSKGRFENLLGEDLGEDHGQWHERRQHPTLEVPYGAPRMSAGHRTALGEAHVIVPITFSKLVWGHILHLPFDVSFNSSVNFKTIYFIWKTTKVGCTCVVENKISGLFIEQGVIQSNV